MIKLDKACTSAEWRLDNFNSGANTGHVYLFEMKFSETIDVLPECTKEEMDLGYDHETSHCLPLPKLPRIQGWCTVHQKAKLGSGAHSGNGKRGNVVWYNTATFPNKLASPTTKDVPPCASKMVIELGFQKYQMWRMTKSSCSASQGVRLAADTVPLPMKDNSKSGIFNYVYQNGDLGCNNNGHVGHNIRGIFIPSSLPLMRGSKTLYLQAAVNKGWYGNARKWQFSGSLYISYWYEPPSETINCTVPANELQYLTHDEP